MELKLYQEICVQAADGDDKGILTLSSLLRYAQQVSGAHSDKLGFDWDTLAEKGLFWAVLRHRVLINRLPRIGETVCLETWPMPSTRAAYPRMVRARDREGNLLFETVSLWVLMNTQTRAMVLPGKSGVDVPGIATGDEPQLPGSVSPKACESNLLWKIGPEDLDINGHVNNANYLRYPQQLLVGRTPRELTACYLSETLSGQEIQVAWQWENGETLHIEGHRTRTDVPEKTERVFAIRVLL